MASLSIYQFEDYKEFVEQYVQNLPKSGYGFYRRLAEALSVSPTLISQVFKGTKDLSVELALEVGEQLHLTDQELDYFLMMVEHSKAGSHKLREKLKKRIKDVQVKVKELDQRLKKDVSLSETVQSEYYSSWVYTGIRNLTALSNFSNEQAIAERLKLPVSTVHRIVNFLVQHNLCKIEKGAIKVGPQRTHVGSKAALVKSHHTNWRLQAIAKLQATDTTDNFHYTGPMSLSKEVAEKIRDELPAFIEKINKQVIPSKSETVRCITLDWFEY